MLTETISSTVRPTDSTKDADRLPMFFLEEKLSPSGNIFDVPEEEIDSINRF
jgi:hypothetical protein